MKIRHRGPCVILPPGLVILTGPLVLSSLSWPGVLFLILGHSFSFTLVLQIMFNLDKVHIILDEMVLNGCAVETNKSRILAPLLVLDKVGES
ncbi:hypothetical protein GDO81_025938 [Engystomops pustulosus]|uniref:AP complex mu/sigma subunit domain-containing protein n=1 Tax=Engystomops pustulosus TaxID=76066 RepID=A0AAV6YJ15_ENGPU|nr:hypothetical protein GDO81_025938 [Engystomops pustulosus]